MGFAPHGYIDSMTSQTTISDKKVAVDFEASKRRRKVVSRLTIKTYISICPITGLNC